MQENGNRLQLKVFLASRVAMETGGVVIDERRFPGRQGRLLFAYLVAEQGRPVPRDELAEALWGESPPATWDKALTVVVSKLRALLTDLGLDGATALTALTATPPALAILDIKMPRMDGLRFLEMLMTHHPLPVVMVSSQTERDAEITRDARLGVERAVVVARVEDVARRNVAVQRQLGPGTADRRQGGCHSPRWLAGRA